MLSSRPAAGIDRAKTGAWPTVRRSTPSPRSPLVTSATRWPLRHELADGTDDHVMRWMERWSTRADAPASRPGQDEPWSGDRRARARVGRVATTPATLVSCATRALNFVLALLALSGAAAGVPAAGGADQAHLARARCSTSRSGSGSTAALPARDGHNHRRAQRPRRAGRSRSTSSARCGSTPSATAAPSGPQQARPPGHPGGPGAAPVPAGRAAPAAQRAPGRDEHRGPPARAAHHLRRAARATSPSTRCASGPSRASPGWPRSTTTTTARWTTCAPR